jgi:uncharacterized protein YbjT (DUF2867 family)
VARALIVGCGHRGRLLGARLLEDGWQVRGTTRSPQRLGAIARGGIEAALADPARPGTVLDLVGDVAVVVWALASASGSRAEVAALHGESLGHLLARLVDSPVRGFVYEVAGSVAAGELESGREQVRRAGETWRMPVALVESDPGDCGAWTAAALGAVAGVLRAPSA